MLDIRVKVFVFIVFFFIGSFRVEKLEVGVRERVFLFYFGLEWVVVLKDR